jgi:two-component system, HptB-dependent secretion and biofilm response regulator
MNEASILLVEDNASTRHTTALLLEKMGHTCMAVDSGPAALDYCENNRPDLILMDVAMPGMDGHETTRRLRARQADDWVPIIFLTAMTSATDMLLGFEAGGDDYLTKPVRFELLQAKIRVFLRIASMQRQITHDALCLARYYEENEFEHSLAHELIQRLTYRSFIGQRHIWHHLNPAGIFNGDIICRSTSAPGKEHFMLGDCTGHGLTAAISALPVIDAFYELVKQYLSTSLIASGINKKLHSLLPTGRFVAGALCSVDYRHQTLSVWNGGIPCALLFGADGRLKQVFQSEHPPLGVLDEDAFDTAPNRCEWSDGDQVVLASDGITEAANEAGQQFGLEGVASAVQQVGHRPIGERILAALAEHLHGTEAKDDVSLLVLQLSAVHD